MLAEIEWRKTKLPKKKRRKGLCMPSTYRRSLWNIRFWTAKHNYEIPFNLNKSSAKSLLSSDSKSCVLFLVYVLKETSPI